MEPLPPLRVAALMSGTSLDGADTLLAELEAAPGGLRWQVLARHAAPYPAGLRARLARALRPESSDVALLTQLHAEVGHAYADALEALLAGRSADLVALSGQTVYHIPRREPERGWTTVSTLQLGEAALVCERLRLPVLSDFRQSDMAAGGQGAPMVAFGDFQLYRRAGVGRAVHNLGGISNLTFLPADGDPEAVFAFDTGPANCLLDEAAQERFGLPCDEGGRLAALGRVDEERLARLLAHPYLALPPPKTTGREVFNLRDIAPQAGLEALSGHDLLATLTAFTAETVAGAYREFVLDRGLDEILVAGGGALNPTLMTELRRRLPVRLLTFEDCGWQAKDREALAFAVMAYFAFFGRTNTLPVATGARRPVVAGKLSRP